ncbi:c-type cytochrome [Paracoccus sp. (in: a-proteobacteria)]|uniref:c-type cytochrome n=1 Tax=Paracoccus sp. TaxID=267 RepID=UPI003A85B9EE
MRLTTLTAVVATAALPLIAHADANEDAVEARQGFFQMLSINMGTLAGMAKGEIAYDEAVASTAAANIEALTHYQLPGLFLEGTAAGTMPDTGALPAIWEKPEDFASKFAGLQEAAMGAADGVKGGQGNIGPVVQKLGGACKACHDDFRQKN